MGLLESALAPPPAPTQARRKRARAPAHAGGPVGSLQLRNRYSALSEPAGQCACSEAHALFEETAELDVLMPLLDTKRMKPEYQGYKRLQVAVGSGASAS
eukprot:9524978-Prorocentrum_lima.AAC.1